MSDRGYFIKVLSENPGLSDKEIVDIISRDCPEMTKSNIQKSLDKVMFNASDVSGKFLYIEGDEQVIFKMPGGDIRVIPASVVDEWYVMYTSDEYTSDDIASRFMMPKHDIKSMFRILGLTKSSCNRAPWVIAKAAQKKGGFKDLADETIDRLEAIYTQTFEDRRVKDLKRKYRNMISSEHQMKRFLEAVKSYSSKVPYTAPKPSTNLDCETDISLCSFISDWHVGAKGFKDELLLGTPYNSDVRDSRLNAFHKEISLYRDRLNSNVKTVHGFILGDMIDDPLGKTFPEQLKEQDLYGADQVVEAVRLIKSYIIHFYNTFPCESNWYFLRGNHGYEFEDVVYHWIEESLSEYEDINIKIIKTKYADVLDDFSKTQIIAMHGEGSLDAKNASLMLDNGSPHRLVVHGHKHTLSMEEIPRGFRVGCPSLVGGNSYSQSKNWNSRAGQILIELHEDGPRPLTYIPLS